MKFPYIFRRKLEGVDLLRLDLGVGPLYFIRHHPKFIQRHFVPVKTMGVFQHG